jgi:hypothetical protein
MASTEKIAAAERVGALMAAQAHLQVARDYAKGAGAPKTLARIKLALTSIGGAIRHAENRATRPLP